jgi:hypothetical protein
VADKDKEFLHPCGSCERDSYHSLLNEHVYSEHEYRMDVLHQLVQCQGCRSVSFRKVVADLEMAYPDEHDEWHVPHDITAYPPILKGHRKFSDAYRIPHPVRDIYEQSVQAMKESSGILAGIGLRATIEAICNEQQIQGRNLEKRIDGLAKKGVISQRDAERLHAIRFLGNDAAHALKSSDLNNLLVALRIIEHLLATVYVLDGDADGALDTVIVSFSKLEMLIRNHLPEFSSGDEVPLSKILGSDIRRLRGKAPDLEKELIEQIAAGTYTRLLTGKIEPYAGSSDPMQHYIVA